MDLDNNFTALLIAIVVISLLVGLAIYYNTPYFKAVQSSPQNTSENSSNKVSPSSQTERNFPEGIHNIQLQWTNLNSKKHLNL